MSRLERKIEEIRQKPEHIRIWYVYGAVAICMIFVLFIFFLNIRINFSGGQEPLEDGTDPFSIIRDEVGKSLNQQDGSSLSDTLNAAKEATQEIAEQVEVVEVSEEEFREPDRQAASQGQQERGGGSLTDRGTPGAIGPQDEGSAERPDIEENGEDNTPKSAFPTE